MTAASTSTCHILVGFDGTPFGERALQQALWLAQDRPNTEPHVLQVTEPTTDSVLDGSASLEDELTVLQQELRTLVDGAIARGDLPRVGAVTAHTAVGAPAAEIVNIPPSGGRPGARHDGR